MLKLKIAFTIILSLLLLSVGVTQQRNERKNILILFSLISTTPAYSVFLNEIRQKLDQEYNDSFNLHTEYLEIEAYPPDSFPQERFDLYNNKYKMIKLDLLICVGRNIIGPIKKHADEYLLNLPTISIDFDFSNYGINKDLSLNDQTTVVGLKFNIDKTISSALSLFPTRSSIYFITGTSAFDKFMMSIAKEIAKNINGNKKVNFMTDLPMDEILRKVHQMSDNSIIFIPVFSSIVGLCHIIILKQ
jgi:hypothetical protein